MSKAKTIEFEYKGNKYVLEYNRTAIEVMEKEGFDMQEFIKKTSNEYQFSISRSFYKKS